MSRIRIARTACACLLLSLTSLVPALTSAAAGDAIDFESRTLTLFLTQEPPQLDSTKATDQVSTEVLGHVMEALTRDDGHGKLVPGVAERWEVREDGATFWLRTNARWSDGMPVTAHDFVFAWRNVVDPVNASEYAFIMSGITNADAIVNGERPIEDLGVRAVSDHVLEVSFERPIAYFARLVAFGTFYPIREDFYRARAGRYAADAEDMLFNGPFVITQWDHGARILMEKNPQYWARDDIWLNAINFAYITSDTSAILNLFKDGRIAHAPLDSETMQNALDQRWRILAFDDGTVWYTEFNHRDGRPTTSRHLRRAMALAFDPYEFVNRVVGTPGNKPGKSIFPAWLSGAHGRLRDEIPPPEPVVDYAEARRELELAKEELGVETIPPLVLLTGDSPVAGKQAEFLQTLWNEVLGLDIRIDKQIFKQRLAKMTAGDFDMVSAGWGPDYNDPLTFGDLFASWNGNNRGRYENPALDACVRTAQNSVDPEVRVEAFGCIQHELLSNNAIIPTYERGQIYVVAPQLRGLVRRQTSPDPDFTRAWFAED
ncbi:MAG TPA: peptide ABC transporter substrate-binding protein [Pseudomonadales bacterium]|nr:peptide ABC transporter substrate-binding protein [Pseudomonadales bacterium]